MKTKDKKSVYKDFLEKNPDDHTAEIALHQKIAALSFLSKAISDIKDKVTPEYLREIVDIGVELATGTRPKTMKDLKGDIRKLDTFEDEDKNFEPAYLYKNDKGLSATKVSQLFESAGKNVDKATIGIAAKRLKMRDDTLRVKFVRYDGKPMPRYTAAGVDALAEVFDVDLAGYGKNLF